MDYFSTIFFQNVNKTAVNVVYPKAAVSAIKKDVQNLTEPEFTQIPHSNSQSLRKNNSIKNVYLCWPSRKLNS